jgi:PTH1 family peptidyl-tRNA hydrolase
MWLVVGLGNPGTRYAHHRHNIGFMAAEAISAAFSFGSWQKKFQGQICSGDIGGEKTLLLLPETYMNLSGKAVQAACTFHKIPPENVIVLHDEIELLPAKIRTKQGGGHGGHNGLRSIDECIGKNYWRVRLGVGRPTPPIEVDDYVLSNFTAEEEKWVTPLLKSVAQHFPLLLAGKDAELMNRVTLDMKATTKE